MRGTLGTDVAVALPLTVLSRYMTPNPSSTRLNRYMTQILPAHT